MAHERKKRKNKASMSIFFEMTIGVNRDEREKK
jgi:hypothetical protein